MSLSFSFLSWAAPNIGVHTPSSVWDQQLGLEEGTIANRSGVQSRFISDPNVEQSAYAARAIQEACLQRNIDVSSIDIVISCCAIGQQPLPYHASHILYHLGIEGKQGFDVNASCLSFLQGLQLAVGLFASNAAFRIALVSCDLPTRGIRMDDPEAGWIFGDGCAAVILENSAKSKLLSHISKTYPEGRDYCTVRGGGTQRNVVVGMSDEDFYFQMDGKRVFKLASQHMESVVNEALTRANVQMPDIAWVVPHQASHLGMFHMRKRLAIPEEKLVNIYSKHGNQVSASMPNTFVCLADSGRVKHGDYLLFLGTAAGLTLSASVVQWGE